MARVLGVLLAGLAVLIAVGVLVPAIYSGRASSDRARCLDHLRCIGAFGTLHASLNATGLPAARTEFPAGTVVSSALEVEDRLSLYANMLAGLRLTDKERQQMRAAPFLSELSSLDATRPWNHPAHDKLARTRISVLICPGNVPPSDLGTPFPAMYLGNGGLGSDTPGRPLAESLRVAGVFRWDTPTLAADATDGLSHSIQFGEVSTFANPWIQGGPATVRGFDPESSPFVGAGRTFGGNHRDGAMFSFADGSAKFLTSKIQSGIFRAMLTIAGLEAEIAE